MKKIYPFFLIACFLAIYSTSFSQVYFPDSTHQQKWEVKYWSWFSCSLFIFKTGNTVSLCGDTYIEVFRCDGDEQNCTIFGYYTNVNNGSTVDVLLRETTDCNDPAYVLYRFNINIGDDVYGHYGWHPEKFTVYDKQTIQYQGVSRENQTMSFQPSNSNLTYYMNWIEGIGSTVHPFYSLTYFDVTLDSYYRLIKVHRDGQVIYHNTSINLSCNVYLRPKLLLEGPYNSTTGEMTNSLGNASLVPTSQPFSYLGYYQNDTTTAAILANNSIVDWVLVELRDAENPTIVCAQQAALLDNNGRVWRTDGIIGVDLWANECIYYVSIVQRNHLSVMTANPISFPILNHSLDFTTTPLYGNNAAKLENGVQLMWAGDADSNGSIDAVDRSTIWNDRNLTSYLGTDTNLDGVVNAADRSDCWNNRNKIAQLP